MSNITHQNEQSNGLISFLEKRNGKPAKGRVYEDPKTYALIYPRVSGLEQRSNYSLENQKKTCEEYAWKENYEILAYFGCTNESAKTDDRAAFQEMLAFARKCKKKIIIITYVLDRFSRTGEGAIEILNQLFAEGIYLQSATNPQEPGTIRGLIQMEKELLEAKHENQKRYLLCHSGMVAKLSEGGWTGKVPYGYYREYPKGGRKRDIYIDEQKAQAVRNIFEWYAYEKLTYAQISLRLQTLGIRLSLQGVGSMLRNPFYAGLVSHGLLEGKVVKGKHEPIISEALFSIVNGYLGKNPSGFTHKQENSTVPLKGFCTCGICGYGLTGYDIEKAGKVYSYYKCQKNCQGVTISAPSLHDMFLEKLKIYQINPMLRPLIKKQVIATFLQLSEKEFENEKVLRTQLTEEKKKLDKLQENLGQGSVPIDVYQKFEPIYKQKIAQLEKELAKTAHDSSNLDNQVQLAIDAAANLLNFWKLLDCRWKRQLQSMVFPSGVQYFKQNEAVLTPEINPIFSIMAQVSKELENGQNQENSGSLCESFISSNFLWVGLCRLIDFLERLNGVSPTVWKSVIHQYSDPISGSPQSIEYKYVSNITDSPQYILQPSITGGTPMYSGINYAPLSASTEMFLNKRGLA